MGEQEAIVGRGSAGDGLVSVTVGADGRVEDVELSPGATGEQVRDAVNAAIDELAAALRAGGGGAFEALDAELDKITAGFEQAIGKVADDLAAAQKRLDSLE